MMQIILSLKNSLMLKSTPNIRTLPQLCDLQRFFFNQINIPQQKVTPINLPFYNFVCYAIQMLTSYTKSHLDITFNVFLVDQHLRRYTNEIQLYRRFVGFLQSWKKYGDTDQGKLFASFLKEKRNQRKTIRLFLKLRKILLKNLNQKILQQIQLTHQDIITIIHTLDMVSLSQRKLLVKKINDYFISKNVKYINNVILNAAKLLEFLLAELNDHEGETEKFNSNLSTKITKILKKQLDFIQEFSQDQIPMDEQSIHHDSFPSMFDSSKQFNMTLFGGSKENEEGSSLTTVNKDSKQSLVNLKKCMKELYMLKEKDLEIDNRFKKISKAKNDIQ